MGVGGGVGVDLLEGGEEGGEVDAVGGAGVLGVGGFGGGDAVFDCRVGLVCGEVWE